MELSPARKELLIAHLDELYINGGHLQEMNEEFEKHEITKEERKELILASSWKNNKAIVSALMMFG